MKITRRDLLKYCATAAGALGLSQSGLLKLQKALAAPGEPPVIWLEGASDIVGSATDTGQIYRNIIDKDQIL